MTREAQLAAIRRDAEAAINRLIAMIATHRSEIIDMMIARADEGYNLYGAEGWRKTAYELDRDTLEELADGGNYQVMRRHRGIPPGTPEA